MGSPFLIIELSTFGLAWGDLLVVGLVGAHDDVAVYAVASRVAAMLAVPVYVMTGVLNPVISTTWARGEIEKLQRILRSCLAAVVAPMICTLIAIVLYGGDFLKLLFGSEYSRGASYLIILAIGAAGNVIFGMGFQVLMMCGRARTATAVTVGFSVATLLSEFLLAQIWGVQGVAFASAGGAFFACITSAIICRYLIDVRTYPGVFELRATLYELLSKYKSDHQRNLDSPNLKNPGGPRER